MSNVFVNRAEKLRDILDAIFCVEVDVNCEVLRFGLCKVEPVRPKTQSVVGAHSARPRAGYRMRRAVLLRSIVGKANLKMAWVSRASPPNPEFMVRLQSKAQAAVGVLEQIMCEWNR